jgi:hypothetical protein
VSWAIAFSIGRPSRVSNRCGSTKMHKAGQLQQLPDQQCACKGLCGADHKRGQGRADQSGIKGLLPGARTSSLEPEGRGTCV